MPKSIIINLEKEVFTESTFVIVPRRLVAFTNDFTLASFIAYLCYWTPKSRQKGQWIAKSYKIIFAEIGLSERIVRRCVKKLEGIQLLKTKVKKFDGTPIVHFQFNLSVFQNSYRAFLVELNGLTQNESLETYKLYESIHTKSHFPLEQFVRSHSDKLYESITKTTTNNKTNITTKRGLSPFQNYSQGIEELDGNVPKEKVIFPFDTEHFSAIWSQWKSYRREKHLKAYSSSEEQAAIFRLQDYNEEFAKELILNAIANGWKDFHFTDTPAKFLASITAKNRSNYSQTPISNSFKQRIHDFNAKWD